MKRFGYALKWGTFLSTLGFVGCILYQIFARLALPTAPSWTEEAARLFFVLAIGCAAGLALRSNEYVSFDYFVRRMPPAGQRRVGQLIDVLTLVLFVLFTYQAGRFVVQGLAERSPSLKFPMAVPFAGVFILGLSLSVYALRRLWMVLRAKGGEV